MPERVEGHKAIFYATKEKAIEWLSQIGPETPIYASWRGLARRLNETDCALDHRGTTAASLPW